MWVGVSFPSLQNFFVAADQRLTTTAAQTDKVFGSCRSCLATELVRFTSIVVPGGPDFNRGDPIADLAASVETSSFQASTFGDSKVAPRVCVAYVSHVVNAAILIAFDRLARESPADHDVVFIHSTDDRDTDAVGLRGNGITRITQDDLLELGFPEKCLCPGWTMTGNLDLVFLAFFRLHPEYDRIWFVEYDVHWVGRWSVLFEHFRHSGADVLGTSMQHIDELPHKLTAYDRPVIVPDHAIWAHRHVIKGFLPICRLSRHALEAMEAAYSGGLGGHYEILVPSVAANAGLLVEDIGGRGLFVRPENRDRFYFARGATYSHSPGSFVFRPEPHVLTRQNTLWHPVKPAGVKILQPMRVRGTLAKNLLEVLKPWIWRCAIWLWFQARWRPLRVPAMAGVAPSTGLFRLKQMFLSAFARAGTVGTHLKES